MTTQNKARLGILMLDTRFPRILGDVGNAKSFDFPVRYRVVQGATPEAIVANDPAPFVQKFVDAGRELVAEGCTGIATTCGFLSLLRADLAQRIGVPIASSALEQAAQIIAGLPQDRSLGILTISERSLTQAHLSAAGVPDGVLVKGMDGTSFSDAILGNRDALDVDRARVEMVDAASRMQHGAPDLGAILLECTNMPPYAADVAQATGLPVYSIASYLNWFHQGLMPPGFAR